MQQQNRSIPFKLSIVFSFRNEEAVLPELIHRIQPVLEKEKQADVLYPPLNLFLSMMTQLTVPCRSCLKNQKFMTLFV